MIVNALIFNVNWFGLILFGNAFIPISVATILYHIYKCSNRNQEILLISFVTIVGIGCDTLLTDMGIFVFANQPLFIPMWLAVLWASFATTINHSLSFMKNRPLIQVVFAGFGGPSSYFAGQRLGSVEFGFNLPVSLVVLSIIWIVLFSLFTSFSRSWEVKYANS